ncbi:MAG: DUF2905 domain-containing protein [Candidatus Hydrogenedentes bacterium]|nr:DUF2905 domain-containing protein [Candidatus Hydrogenedentota bacterium]
MNGVGKLLILSGIVITIVGLVLVVGAHLPLKLGKLPGDIHIEGKSGSFYFPITTSLIISLILTILLNLLLFFINFFNK